MKILDLVENIITETDEQLLQKLLDKFRKTTGEFNNASHKFYSVRKALANELEGEEQEAVKKASPGEFFNYLKSQKGKTQKSAQSVTEPPKEEPKPEPKQDLELRGVTHEELDQAGTIYAIINKWVDLYHPKYSAEEIAEALYKSAMGSFEELPYIKKEVNSAIIKKKEQERKEKESKYRPQMEKQFKLSKSQVEELKGSDIYKEVLNDMIGMVKNQARVPGDKPTPAYKMYGYIKNTLEIQYNARAINNYIEGNKDESQKLVTKRDIVKNISSREFRDWYAQNK